MRNDINSLNDALEAVSVLRTAKNLFFFLSMLSLLVLGTIFVFSRIGMIEYPWAAIGCTDKVPAAAEPAESEVAVPALAATVNAPEMPVPAAEPQQTPQAPAAAADAQQAAPVTAAATEQVKEPAQEPAAATDTAPVEEQIAEQPSFDEQVQLEPASWKLNWKDASSLIRLCNAVAVLSLALYCFTLLIGMKLTIVARLSGVYSITSAMFLSMFAAVLFMPWQAAFPGVGLAGAMYIPYEFACATMNFDNLSKVEATLFYARYLGLWMIVIISLVMAQGRSMRWVSKCLNTDKD